MSKIQVNEIVNHFDNGAPDCPRGLTVTGVSTFSGNVSIGGTLSYEDVTNIDSVGIITAQAGIRVTGGDLSIEGSASQILSIFCNDTGVQATPRTFINLYGDNTANEKKLQAQIASAPGAVASSAGELHFSTNNSSSVITRRMTINQDGDVGIGTENPSGRLHVYGSGNDESRITITTPTRTLTRIGYYGLEKFGIDMQAGLQIRDADSSYATRFLIDSTGKIGINETSPSAILSVKGTVTAGAGSNEDLQQWNIGSDNVKAEIKYIDTSASRGMLFGTTTDHNLAFQTNNTERLRLDNLGRLLVGTTSSIDTSSYIQSYRASGTNTITIQSGSTANNETARVIVQTLSPANRFGQFAVGKHSAITNPVAYIELNQEDGNQSFFWFDNSAIARTSPTFGHTGTTSGTVIGTQTSDKRLKNVGANVAYGLAEVKQLQPKQYALKTEPDTNKLGFIAQEVESIIPEAVFNTGVELTGHQEGDRTRLGMEYVQLIPVLVNAIKELSSKVETLEAEVQALKGS